MLFELAKRNAYLFSCMELKFVRRTQLIDIHYSLQQTRKCMKYSVLYRKTYMKYVYTLA